jgi:hypothetical protein
MRHLHKLKHHVKRAILPFCLGFALSSRLLVPYQQGKENAREPLSFSYGYSSEPMVEIICNDRVDNDGDSLVDCEDFEDCALSEFCAEICDNNIDDDEDGAIDCDDLWCQEYDENC